MKRKTIQFRDWAPDKGLLNAEDAWLINGGVPSPGGYENAIQAASSTFGTYSGTAVAPGMSVVDKAGDPYFFLGTSTHIHRASATSSFTNVSGTTYNATAWDFAQWGDEVYATNFADEIQSMVIATSSFTSLTSEPKAKWITTARNFGIIGYTWDSTDGTSPNRVRWSAINDIADWTVSSATQSDFQDLESSRGVVQRVFGGEYAVVFQERGITRMSYVGSPLVWQFDTVQPELGLYGPYAAAQRGDMIYFLSEDGFYVLLNGSEARPLGRDKVTRTFFDRLDTSKRDEVTCAIDPHASRVYWQYHDTVSDSVKEALVYDYVLDRWGFATLTGLTRPAPFLSKVRQSVLSFVDVANSNIGLLNSTATSSMVIQTGLVSLSPNRNSMTKSVQVFANSTNFQGISIGTGSVRLQVLGVVNYRDDSPTTVVTYDEATDGARDTGRIPVRVSGKLHKFNLTFSTPRPSIDEAAEVYGLDVEYNSKGWR